jgi:hypothetical protein
MPTATTSTSDDTNLGGNPAAGPRTGGMTMEDEYLNYAPDFLKGYDALFENAEPTEDEIATYLYERWLVMPMQKISKWLDVHLCRRFVIDDPHCPSGDELIVHLDGEPIDGYCDKPARLLADVVAEAFLWEKRSDFDALATDIRKAVEAGIAKGMACKETYEEMSSRRYRESRAT